MAIELTAGRRAVGDVAPHLTFYAGWPCAVTAVRLAREVLAEQG